MLRIDDAYEHALVGTPDRRHLWLLGRQPQPSDAVEQAFLQTARDQGFDLARGIRPQQSGRRVEL